MHFLKMRPEQMQAFEADVLRRFVAREIARVGATHGLERAQAKAVVEGAVERARAVDIDEESDVSTLADWYAVRGVGFDGKHDRLATILEDRSLPGWARMKMAAKLLEQR